MARRSAGSRRGRCSCCLAVIFALIVAAAYLILRDGDRSERPTRRPDPPAGVSMVEIDLSRGYRVEPVMAKNKAEGDIFPEMVTRLRPHAAINGTFYDENKRPLGDVVIDGKLVNRGHYRTAIGVRNDGAIVFRHRRSGRFDWNGYRAGLAAGPRLVCEAKIACNPVADGFGPGSVTLRARRAGVGLTGDNRLLMVTDTRTVTLAEFAETMLGLGCVDAMNLDGGGACGLYGDGEMLMIPGLMMSNILVAYEK